MINYTELRLNTSQMADSNGKYNIKIIKNQAYIYLGLNQDNFISLQFIKTEFAFKLLNIIMNLVIMQKLIL